MTDLQQAPSAGFASGHKQLFRDGDWVESSSGEADFESINPADESVLATVAAGGAEDVDRAVRSARNAFDGPWSAMAPAQRGRLLWRVGDLILENLDEIALLEAMDAGKTLAVAKMEIESAANHWHYFAGWADKIEGTTGDITSPIPGMQFTRQGLRQPLGVVGLITPWNFPFNEASYKLAPALAAGNTAVLKPAEQTPLSALRLAQLITEAGVPDGVVNVVTGDAVAGAALVEHRGVAKVSFTGSTEVGRSILKGSSVNLKRVTLELGGKSPGVIFADADLQSAVMWATSAAFANAGQVCTATSRIFVERSALDDVVAGLSAAANATKLGNGLDPETQMGPLISAEQLERVSHYVEIGRKEANLVAGGEVTRPGYFHSPTVFVTDHADVTIARDEIFGPVVVIQAFDTFDEVIKLSNDTDYGLAAGIWTSNGAVAARAARQIQAGMVWVNNYMVSDSSCSVGGLKDSGVGYDLGPEAVYGFTHLKNVITSI